MLRRLLLAVRESALFYLLGFAAAVKWTRYAIAVPGIVLAAGPQATPQEGPVWSWFAACGGPAMAIEVQLDGATVFMAEFPVCRADRESVVGQGQRIGRIRFSLTPVRPIVWEGYRDARDITKAGQVLDGDLWQAGADPDDLLIGVSFSDGHAIYMNTIHIAHPTRPDESEIAGGLKVVTYPLANGSETKK